MSREHLIFKARSLNPARLPRIDCHLHTSWTDGKPTVAEAYQRACEEGLSAVLYSEHSRKTSTDWFPAFAAEVRALPAAPCRAFVGSECKIETVGGDVDTAPAISDLCDFIMAAVHRFPSPDGGAIPFADVDAATAVDMEFALSWAALANPQVDILAHVFGMSYRRFNAEPPDEKIRALVARAAEFGVAIEVNAHYHSNPRRLLAICQEFDAHVTFGSNSHTLETVGLIARMFDEGAP